MDIFVSYRRGPTQDIVGRICDRLRLKFGQVFHDLASLGGGVKFDGSTMAALARAKVVLVVIGPDWLRGGDILSPDDWVRREIEAVLYRSDVLLIPVLVLGATLPRSEDLPESLRPLLQRQAVTVSSGVDFGSHMAQLERAIKPFVARRSTWLIAASATGLLAVASAAAWVGLGNQAPAPETEITQEPPGADPTSEPLGAQAAVLGGADTVGTSADSDTAPEQSEPSGDRVSGDEPPADEPERAVGNKGDKPGPRSAPAECQTGDVETEACGDCGTRKRTCNEARRWDSFTACVGDTTKMNNAACGNCGTKTQRCSPDGTWGPFGDCGQGECAPGATRTVACGRCGKRQDHCGSSCTWSEGSCTGEGACTPGQRQSCGNTHTTCRQGQRTCSSQCQWGTCVGASCDKFPVPTNNSDFKCGPDMFNTSVCNRDITATCPAGSEATGKCDPVVNYGGRGTCQVIGITHSGRTVKAKVRATVGATQGTGCRIDKCECRYPAL